MTGCVVTPTKLLTGDSTTLTIATTFTGQPTTFPFTFGIKLAGVSTTIGKLLASATSATSVPISRLSAC